VSIVRTIGDALAAVSAHVSFFWTRDRGQTLAEYGLILTLVAVGVVIPTMLIFREQLIDAYYAATDCMNGSC
jgi:Flp pilus assembly pilin Flp